MLEGFARLHDEREGDGQRSGELNQMCFVLSFLHALLALRRRYGFQAPTRALTPLRLTFRFQRLVNYHILTGCGFAGVQGLVPRSGGFSVIDVATATISSLF